jgi:hypothetical protein
MWCELLQNRLCVYTRIVPQLCHIRMLLFPEYLYMEEFTWCKFPYSDNSSEYD